jgi:hypothetical protein
MRCALFMTILLVTAASGAHAQLVDIHWSGEGRFAHQGSVAAGKFVEVCGKLPAGLSVRWDFTAGTPMDFNVHYHQGKDVVFPAKLSAVASARDVLVTKIEQDYCWMWENPSAAAATLTVNLAR